MLKSDAPNTAARTERGVATSPQRAFYNKSVFVATEAHARIEIDHVVRPLLRPPVELTPRGGGAHLSRLVDFNGPEVTPAMRHLATTANEQVLGRLEAVLAGVPPR